MKAFFAVLVLGLGLFSLFLVSSPAKIYAMASVDQSADNTESTANTDDTDNSGEISNDLVTPKNFKVTPNQDGSIKLDWQASITADIDGYKIYRSTEEKKGFKEIAKVDNKTLTYTDKTTTKGTTYYYYISAYKGDLGSVQSATVSGAAAGAVAKKSTKTTLWYILGGVGLAVFISAGFFIYYKKLRKPKVVN